MNAAWPIAGAIPSFADPGRWPVLIVTGESLTFEPMNDAAKMPDRRHAWAFLSEARDEDIPLAWAALTLARDEYPDLDIADYLARIDALGATCRERVSGDDPLDHVRLLNQLLYRELGFSGNQNDYYDPRNSYLNDVLDRRLGIPISLAVIQLELAGRLGLPLKGISFPGHFLVSLPVDDGLLVLDPYHQGRSIDAEELKQRAMPHLGQQELRDDQLSALLSPASNRSILVRMLRNLKALYSERDDYDRALRSADRLVTLNGQDATEHRDRGLLYLRVGHLKAGRSDLTHYLAAQPEADDHGEIRQLLIESGAGAARLH
jgi:regulator of sirC expression with transglutaminase-like and TPR domain